MCQDHTIEEFDFSNFERNDRYLQIVKAFMTQQDDLRLTSLEEGVISLKMVLAAKSASENDTIIKM
jgi:hypothetical protein